MESEAVTHTQRESHRNKCRRIVEMVQSSGAPAWSCLHHRFSLQPSFSSPVQSLIPRPCLQSGTWEGGREIGFTGVTRLLQSI